LQADLADHLMRQSVAAEFLNVAIVALVAGVFWDDFPLAALAMWLGSVLAATGMRTLLRRRLTRDRAPAPRILRTLRIPIALGGLAWGMGPLLLASSLTMAQLGLMMMLSAGLVAGATSSLASDRMTFYLFETALLLPLAAAAGLAEQAPEHGTAAIMVIAYGVVMSVLAREPHRVLRSALSTARELEAAQSTNQRERAFLDALMWSAPTAIVAVDRQGRVLGTNPAFEALFGWAPDDVQGKELDPLIVPPELREVAGNIFERVAQGEVVEEHVFRQRRDGRKIPVRISAAPVYDMEEQAVLALYDDRSSEEQAYEALRQTEQHYRNLVESSTDLVWKVDRQGRWTFLNAASAELYGARPEELVGTQFGDRVAPSRRGADLAALDSVFEGHSLSDYETQHHTLDGTVRHLSFSGRPIVNASGAIVGAQGTARDVSERATVRTALESAHALAQENARTKSAFLANMSHEIRTPMNGVIGMVEVLMDSELDKDQRRSTEVIRSSAQALLGLIDDILDFSKLESGAVTLERLPFELASFLDTTLQLFRPEADKKGLDLTLSIAAAVPPRVLGDPGRMRQILTNLLGNALKFTHQGTVRVEVAAASDPGGVDRLVFEVADTGIGIGADKVNSIFEEFSQADASTTRQYGGTGLGLAICKRLVETMSGGIDVRSGVGVGSHFTFWVPLHSAPPEAGCALPARITGRRALVTAYRPGDRRMVRQALEDLGVLVEECTSIQDTVAHLVDPANRPDFVVTDRRLEDGDGFQLAQVLDEQPNAGDLPMLLVASNPRRGEGRRCREAGIEGYLPRPFRRADLLETVARLLGTGGTADTQKELVTRHSIAEARRRLSILLVEDNPLNQEVATALLKRRGHDITVVGCGLDAVEAAGQMRPDVILMDIQLPDIDGVEATRRIRASEKEEPVPIVALTAHAFQQERERALDAGMNGFLSKPFQPHQLFAMVEGWAAPDIEPAVLVPADSSVPDPLEPPVDVEAFRAEMREAGIEGVVDDSLLLFRDTAPARLRVLQEAGTRGDLEQVRREAHGLKSPAGTIKAHRLHGLLSDVEDLAFAGDLDAVQAKVPETVEAGLAAVAFLKVSAVDT